VTAATLVIVYCDTCGPAGSELATLATADAARRQLAGRGWQVNVSHPQAPGRRLDFCPQHRIGRPHD
jgi:hypothetical protein